MQIVSIAIFCCCFGFAEYEQVSGDSGDENDRIQSSYPDSVISRSVGSSNSSISINCETQTLPVDELINRNGHNNEDDDDNHKEELDSMEIKSSKSHGGHQHATSWDKFRLLMWKNGLLQWRHKWQLIIEIIVPVLFSALMVMIRSLVTPELIANATVYNSFDINSLDTLR